MLFSGLDVVVGPGDVVGLVGPNRSGKSTLLAVLAGRRAPEAGQAARVGLAGLLLSRYDAYLEQRSLTRQHAREVYEEYAARRSALEARARMQRAWMDKGVRAAVSQRVWNDEKDENSRAHLRATSEKQAAKARQTDRMLERLEEVAEVVGGGA